jgi:hypothetical protein
MLLAAGNLSEDLKTNFEFVLTLLALIFRSAWDDPLYVQGNIFVDQQLKLALAFPVFLLFQSTTILADLRLLRLLFFLISRGTTPAGEVKAPHGGS